VATSGLKDIRANGPVLLLHQAPYSSAARAWGQHLDASSASNTICLHVLQCTGQHSSNPLTQYRQTAVQHHTTHRVTPVHLNVCRSVPVAVSHSRSLPSSQHDSSKSSRGLQATYSTAAPCPPSLCRSVQRPVLGQTCHKMTQRSCTVRQREAAQASHAAGVQHRAEQRMCA
jgi:hypothetical protein